MDLSDELEQGDSGMESLTTSKDETPERKPDDELAVPCLEIAKPCAIEALEGKEWEDEPDESWSERLWGLSEMFPDSFRKATYLASSNTWSGVRSVYGLSRTVLWIIASSSVILFAPVILEVERAQMDEMQKNQQKQVLLGPNAALASSMPSMPPMPR